MHYVRIYVEIRKRSQRTGAVRRKREAVPDCVQPVDTRHIHVLVDWAEGH
jgi:hypothetical protein